MFRDGRRVQSGALLLHARRRVPDEGVPDGPRVAVIAARRFPSAVARNRARRVMREAGRALLRGAREPWDIALVVRTESLEQSHSDRLAALAGLLCRAGIISDEAVAAQ